MSKSTLISKCVCHVPHLLVEQIVRFFIVFPIRSCLTSKSDIILATRKGHVLKRVRKEMHQILDELRLTLRPEKTFVGRNRKGFDLLGYYITPNGFPPNQKTEEKALEKAKRHYAQGDKKPLHLYLHR